MTLVNFVLQGKGGVGKSVVASLLAQHYRARGVEPMCIDTDPVNATFAGYAAHAARRIELMVDADIDPRAFDQLIEAILDASAEQVVIVDNGAATFVPLCAYLVENGVVGYLAGEDYEVRFHTVITGGQGLRDTMAGFDDLCEHFPDVEMVVWLNEYFGRLAENGKGFEQSKVYQARVHGMVTLPALRPATFGRDVEAMLRARLTFDEAAADPAFSVMASQRLKTVWRDLGARMDRARKAPNIHLRTSAFRPAGSALAATESREAVSGASACAWSSGTPRLVGKSTNASLSKVSMLTPRPCGPRGGE